LDLYIRSIDRRWRNELHGDNAKIQVFSPYLTSKTADSVLSRLGEGVCEIYTLFEMDVFASGASSLTTLTKLHAQGHQFFHLPELHAKIILAPGEFASIGSQNLTSRGTRNKEATIAFNDSASLQKLEKSLQPWLSERLPITAEMIADMEEMLPPVRRLYLAAQAAAKDADAEILRRREQRDREHEQRKQLNREKFKRLGLVYKAIQRAPKSPQVSYGTVKLMESDKYSWETRTYSFSETKSLVVGREDDLTLWRVEGKRVDLTPRNRYLCVHRNGTKLGWARVGKTRITYIGTGVTRTDPTWVNGQRCILSFRADWSRDPLLGRNATVKVSHLSGNLVCVVSVWFSIDDILVLGVEPSAGGRLAETTKSVMADWVRENPIDFRKAVLPHFVKPFLYEERLTGVQATEFFGPIGSRYELGLIHADGNPVLTATSLLP
jgi:Skp family chaperone for outer membrane proteins